MHSLSIGEVARQSGIAASALRYYESQGILPEPERVHGQRRYDSAALLRLKLVNMAQEAGFSIAEIRTLVSGFPDDVSAGDRWRELASRKLVDVAALIQRMQVVQVVLEESLACNCLTLDACAAQDWGSHSAARIRSVRQEKFAIPPKSLNQDQDDCDFLAAKMD